MGAEFLQAVRSDVLQSGLSVSILALRSLSDPREAQHCSFLQSIITHVDIHASCASCDFATLPQAVRLSLAIRFRLAHHVVIVVGPASCTNEERGAQERS